MKKKINYFKSDKVDALQMHNTLAGKRTQTNNAGCKDWTNRILWWDRGYDECSGCTVTIWNP
jgi:hypothetical protein